MIIMQSKWGSINRLVKWPCICLQWNNNMIQLKQRATHQNYPLLNIFAFVAKRCMSWYKSLKTNTKFTTTNLTKTFHNFGLYKSTPLKWHLLWNMRLQNNMTSTWLPQPEIFEFPWIFPWLFWKNVKFPWPSELTTISQISPDNGPNTPLTAIPHPFISALSKSSVMYMN